jgi:hypothetical protein
MIDGEPGRKGSSASALDSGFELADRARFGQEDARIARPSIVVTEVSPFHCLYQDALEFHSQSRLMLARSEGASSRLARAGLLLYVASAEAIVHQAATELARPELAKVVSDSSRPLPLLDAWRLLPSILGQGPSGSCDPDSAPWPQFAELLELRSSWNYPGRAQERKAYYRSSKPGSDFEPLHPYQLEPGSAVTPDDLQYPRTGLPRDPYALRPHHLDTARGVLDAAIASLDRRLEGALTRDNRHRREPTRLLQPPSP